jgi:PIN domain nuclease of toxin-antitoxin system
VTNEEAGAVLDASALLAYLQGETGSEIVMAALAIGAEINTDNYAEVLSRLHDAGEDPVSANRRLKEHGLIGGLLEVVSLTEDDAVAIARLRNLTRERGLSLGDRACLATGLRLGRPVMTADRAWSTIDIGVDVRQIRP